MKTINKIMYKKIKGYLIQLLVVVGLICGFRSMVMVVVVDGSSMDPTFTDHERGLALINFRKGSPDRYSPVIIDFDNSDSLWVKRVIGLPNEKIEAKNGKVYVNDIPLDEPYLSKDRMTSDFGPVVLKEDEYWVMGDNRPVSQDSRVIGPVKADRIRSEHLVFF
ncbi:signal peptidase I [Ileibacterium valens]|uniref:signal peptidase I n=1 Tax=Ileibacterium valens TaxID=1862668 RepID=UPI003517861D